MIVSLRRPDVDTLETLFTLSREQHEHEALPFDREPVVSTFNTLLSQPERGDVFLIDVEHEGRTDTIGFIVLAYSFSVENGGSVGVIDQFFIQQTWRRQGVGSQVIPEVEKQAKTRQCVAVILEMNIGNKGARLFYEQFDYQPRRQHCIFTKRL
ncbi:MULTISPECIES: GNAT family N-acetyltransferase [Salinivibrio]|jgi:GNAT superfamily N-acetyltransferase|uniref:GNAT family N-acetyltransferase n=1 Tax=Salinivibrio costicola subsp. alcaliphilus TaxID=272773 RepID=A0ABX3KU39_SALCS|nr:MULTISPECIES: GNAT family N-acetyltransferase [Salinivibrio]OOE92897.1 GNAT family N-acetyltransferase [Salinivibrio sp. AR647]OOF04781.1 GNAT family N-acetyltransferase [Salinivibrio sp. MA440]OOF34943.1 GNAT family N-acetyltransferase [Salinivibrio costicola subsp. alcaliphilus]